MKQYLEDELTTQINYMVANLLDHFRDPRNESRFFDAAKIAFNQIARIAPKDAQSLMKRFVFFAANLKNNMTPNTIKCFAQQCVDAALRKGIFADQKPVVLEKSERNLMKAAEYSLNESLSLGHSQDVALLRAANSLWRVKQKTERRHRIGGLAENHPLRDTLRVFKTAEQPLPKEDIRNKMLALPKKRNAKDSGVLFGLLARAQAFSAVNLYRLLGDELFFLCRPLGFLDQGASILIVEVPTNAHLHMLSYKKLEIIKALKKNPTFATVKNIRFKVGRA